MIIRLLLLSALLFTTNQQNIHTDTGAQLIQTCQTVESYYTKFRNMYWYELEVHHLQVNHIPEVKPIFQKHLYCHCSKYWCAVMLVCNNDTLAKVCFLYAVVFPATLYMVLLALVCKSANILLFKEMYNVMILNLSLCIFMLLEFIQSESSFISLNFKLLLPSTIYLQTFKWRCFVIEFLLVKYFVLV